jgi:hypothetical protein
MVLMNGSAEDHELDEGTIAPIYKCMTLQRLHKTLHTVSHGTMGVNRCQYFQQGAILEQQCILACHQASRSTH